MDPNPPIAFEAKDEGNYNIGSSVSEQTNRIKEEPTDINISSTVANAPENANQNPIYVDSSEGEIDESSQDPENANNQLVLYDSSAAGGEIVPANPEQTPRLSSRVLPAVGAFTVQCANCFQWRLIPTKEKYEQIREHILEKPFYCETAREWRPDISCNDPADISQDGSRLWAIDKPNIAQPPPGWQRLLRIRAEGGTKFADVYYQAPSGKRMRSMVEVEKYLSENPKYVEEGIRLSQFSFQIPKPLQENYVRKRPARPASGFAEPSEVSPIAWISPEDQKISNAFSDAYLAELSNEAKRRKT